MNRIKQAAAPIRTRRGTSRLAVVVATLAVPLIPGQAVAAAPTNGGGVATVGAPHSQRYFHSQAYPDSVMVQEWEVRGWTVTFAGRPEGLGRPRGRVLPDPLNPLMSARTPPNTKQMVTGADQGTDMPEAVADATVPAVPADLRTSACCRLDDSVGIGAMRTRATDAYMLARLRPARDPMYVVVNRGNAPCGARVDYLSQARA